MKWRGEGEMAAATRPSIRLTAAVAATCLAALTLMVAASSVGESSQVVGRGEAGGLAVSGGSWSSRQTELLEQEEADGEVGTPFHMTKWGPLRSKKWQSSRYRVLALWQAASRSLETCMDAENFVFPHAQDSSCRDVVRTFDGVRQCMRHQHDGMRGLAAGKQGAWEALSSIVDETKALGGNDKEMVSKKISGDAALYTLARLDALHARCSQAGRARPSSREFAPLTYDPQDPVFQAERAVGYVRGQEPPQQQGNAEGEWPVHVDLSDLPQADEGTYGVKRDGWDSIRRASRRGYLA